MSTRSDIKPELLYVDLFCGAGGTTTGIELSKKAKVIACVNHDAVAIASHAMNHPDVLHFTEDIRILETAPILAKIEEELLKYPGALLALWASCECTNFSRAKGGLSRDQDSRTLAEHLYRYIDDLDPDYIQVENVSEFMEWGPLVEKDGKMVPDKEKKGIYFERWIGRIENTGYRVEYRVLNAADYGAYTSRRRLFIQCAKGDLPITWPKATHPKKSWKACKDILDLNDYGKSIFSRKKPLCESTLRRLTEGVTKFADRRTCQNRTRQFITRYFSGKGHNTSVESPCGTITTIPHQYPVTAHFVDNYFGKGYPTSVEEPIGCICTKQQRYPVSAIFMANAYSGGGQLSSIDSPIPTILTVNKSSKVNCQFVDMQFGNSKTRGIDYIFPAVMTNQHYSQVTACYIRASMRPASKGLIYSVNDPMKTILTRDYFYLDTLKYGTLKNNSVPKKDDTEAMAALKEAMLERGIRDICMRPISVKESLKAMGFPEDYKLAGTQTLQRKFIGNAVEVISASKLIEACADAVASYKEQHQLFRAGADNFSKH